MQLNCTRIKTLQRINTVIWLSLTTIRLVYECMNVQYMKYMIGELDRLMVILIFAVGYRVIIDC